MQERQRLTKDSLRAVPVLGSEERIWPFTIRTWDVFIRGTGRKYGADYSGYHWLACSAKRQALKKLNRDKEE